MKEKRMSKDNLKIICSKGITLIALIITIIIMLILVTVSISIAVNSGLFQSAGKAAKDTRKAGEKEQKLAEGKIVIGGQEVNIADIVNGKVDFTAEVNRPELIEGMIAVQWDGSKWIKADEAKDNWYEYGTTQESKRWANAVTVKEVGTQTRESYQAAPEGTEIKEADILGMYVWIPRYSYKIVRGYHTNNNGNSETDSGFVEIEFLKGTGKSITEYNAETTENYTKFPEGYITHPAFTQGSQELTGIWVAKFEASSSTTTESNPNTGNKYGRTGNPSIGVDEVTIRPNVTSWRAIDVNDCYEASTNMTKTNNIHGLDTTADSHLMKDWEWGAVAYLTQSAYGNAQVSSTTGVWNNSYYEGDAANIGESDYAGYTFYGTTKTGMVGIRKNVDGTYAASGRDNSSSGASLATDRTTNGDGSITITYNTYNKGDTADATGETYTNTYYTYETANGVKGSTTGTIYGIYDMAGGACEYQATYLNEVNNTFTNYFNTNVPKKHKTTFAGTAGIQYDSEGKVISDGRVINYELNKDKYGNAIWETSKSAIGARSWNGDNSNFMISDNPFILRGGDFNYGNGGGLFYFTYSTGNTFTIYGFRPVLSATF